MTVKVAAIFYSSTSNVYQLMEAVAEGAREAGAEVRLHIVPELAPPEAIAQNPDWQAFRDTTASELEEATLDDLEWADAYIFGSPTRFGNVAAQLKQFLDTAGGLWAQGKLANKVVAGVTSASNPNGGQESTLLALYNTMHHWGAILVPPGYTAQSVTDAGGNPYGVSSTGAPTEADLRAARYLGKRVTIVTEHLQECWDTIGQMPE